MHRPLCHIPHFTRLYPILSALSALYFTHISSTHRVRRDTRRQSFSQYELITAGIQATTEYTAEQKKMLLSQPMKDDMLKQHFF